VKKHSNYLHGYTLKEQKRLIHQARFLAPWVYRDIDYTNSKKLLEVGCGVGAQTEILLKKFPHLQITGVDISEAQLEFARRRLHSYIKSGQVTLVQADATEIPLARKSYDAAFICWFLEHVPQPAQVLKELRTKLIPGARLFCTEVNNASLFVDPYSPTILKYWFEFNDYQWLIKGHPFVGAQLGNLLHEIGYKRINTQTRPLHFDSRQKAVRAKFIRLWTDIMLSAAPGLLAEKRISKKELVALKKEFKRLEVADDSVFYYAFMQAHAHA
jgi:ubiquinone/menaquinone biosynthesis C-methylase UbiE